MSKWVKKNCYVVYAYYRDELYQNGESPMREEEVFTSYAKAEDCKKEFETDCDFESVIIEEEERELLYDDYDKEYLNTLGYGELLAMLDDEVQKLVGDNNDEWARRKKKEYLAIKNAIASRLS